MSDFRVVPLNPSHLASIQRQASQQVQLGIDATLSEEEAYELASEEEAWACFDGDRLIACLGIRETFPAVQGVAWAVLADGLGRCHLALTRFARSRILGSRLRRIEAITRASDAEAILDHFPGLDGAMLLEAVLAQPTPECIWAKLCGLRPAHVLRCFGAASETQVLFERINRSGFGVDYGESY